MPPPTAQLYRPQVLQLLEHLLGIRAYEINGEGKAWALTSQRSGFSSRISRH